MMPPVPRQEVVAHPYQTHGVSQRRACRVIGADRTSIRYRSRRPDDAAVRAPLREIAAARRRFGYPTDQGRITTDDNKSRKKWTVRSILLPRIGIELMRPVRSMERG